MSVDFITLCKLGVGPVLVRHSDIITMELTPYNYTRIEFGYGEHLIVEESPAHIIKLIKVIEEIEEIQQQAKELKTNSNDK
jgi:hypothetical protein